MVVLFFDIVYINIGLLCITDKRKHIGCIMNKRQVRRGFEQVGRKIHISRGGLNFRRRRRKIQGEKVRYVSLWVIQIFAVVLLAFFLTLGFGTRIRCSGESMTPAIAENGSVLINRIAYKIKAPKKGDVVAFMPKGNTSANYNVKRIVAVPGDTVLISNGRLYVNDKVVNLKQSDDKSIKDEGRAVTEITLGKNEYFVLGDNVNNSEDSRYGSIGNVTRKEMIGKVWFCLSFKGFGTVH